MNLVVKLGVAGIGVMAGLAFVACSSKTETDSAGSGASSSGAGGQGGGASVSASSSGSGVGGSGGGAFIDCPESPANFAMGECDLLNPDCPPGKACFPVKPLGSSKLTTQCVNWSGVKGPGAACSSNQECAAGLFCAIYCAPPCCHTAGLSTCDCSISINGFEDPAATLWACNYLPICEIFVADSCMKYPGTQCHSQNIGEDLSTCAPPSPVQMPPTEGKSCTFQNDCEAMQTCNNKTCRYNCLIDSFMSKAVGEGGCPGVQKCATVVAGKNVGICVP